MSKLYQQSNLITIKQMPDKTYHALWDTAWPSTITVLLGVMWNFNCNTYPNVTLLRQLLNLNGSSGAHVPPFHQILWKSV